MQRIFDTRQQARTALLAAGYWPMCIAQPETWAKRSRLSDRKIITREVIEADERFVVASL